jgi:argininosuccinate synthase
MLRFAQALDVPAHVELLFEQGIPVAVNGVSMGLPELTESLATIAADHGVGTSDSAPVTVSTPADLVLDQARRALASGVNERGTGVVRMKLHLGEQTIVSVSPPDPLLS